MNQLTGVEKAFVINLLGRIDRRKHTIEEMKKIDIPYRFWWANEREDGKQGLVDTMIYLLDHAEASGLERIVIFEDDVEFVVDKPVDQIQKCLSKVPDDFDLLYLGCNLDDKKVKKVKGCLINVQAAYATHAIVYSKSGIKKVLNAIRENKEDPIDVSIVNHVQKDGKCYCTIPLIASQINGYSDIEKREVNYKIFLEQKFAQKIKDL